MSLVSPKITQPLKWHGGKHYLAKKIIGLMPREPFGGGLAKGPVDARNQ
ncbi:MAG: hypothetical protein R3C18_21225 [Planctomycetaceae bacterium]